MNHDIYASGCMSTALFFARIERIRSGVSHWCDAGIPEVSRGSLSPNASHHGRAVSLPIGTGLLWMLARLLCVDTFALPSLPAIALPRR